MGETMYKLEQNSAGEYYISESNSGTWTYSFYQVKEHAGINYWKVINPNASKSPIRYDGARDAYQDEQFEWHYNAWYGISKRDRQRYFRQGNKMIHSQPFTQHYYTDVTCRGCDYPRAETLACTPSPAPEGRWYHGDFFPVSNQEGNNPMNTLNATATVNTKTDLQTQREYLLGRHNDISRSGDYGCIDSRMTNAFNLNVDNEPKTSKELFDGIKSGKFTLDEKKVPLQEIAAARGSSFYDDNDDFVHLSPTWAINWGGLTPDRLGFEKAKDAFRTALKLAKDEIMTGDPSTSVKTLQDLENWTPPAAAN